MNNKILQKLVDHWHIGQCQKFREQPGQIKVTTNKGKFMLIEISRQQWQEKSYEQVIELFKQQNPESQRLGDPLFCHVKGYYYCAFYLPV